jgi:hypothetical protein
MSQKEYSACEIRRILQALFPNRRLVLSQFTFFNQIGLAKATGNELRRGRRCYTLENILPIAAVLALKEEGIPFKNLGDVHNAIHDKLDKIFDASETSLLMGYGDCVRLNIASESTPMDPLDLMLGSTNSPSLFWCFNLGVLAQQLITIALHDNLELVDQKAA